MIHVMLLNLLSFDEYKITPSQKEEIKFKQDQIIKFVKKNVRDHNINYKLHFFNRTIFDNEISDLDVNDIIMWHPNVAASNLDIVKRFQYSIVLLVSSTILVQQVSLSNPINENMAVNHGFHILYMDEKYNDETNKEWKLVVEKDQYLVTLENLQKLLL